MARYSEAALAKRRAENFDHWLRAAIDKHGQQFDYASTAAEFRTQKRPAVTIRCAEHGLFNVSPHDHLRFAGGGCRDCGLSIRGKSKKTGQGTRFNDFFKESLSHRLELMTLYSGAKAAITVRCRLHDSEFVTTPDTLLQGGFGCYICARDSAKEKLWLTKERVVAELADKLPAHVRIIDVERHETGSYIVIECEVHGRTSVRKSGLSNSQYGCPKCGIEQIGYAANRIRKLLDRGERGQKTWLAVMEVEAFGVSALKVGVTRRSLAGRYGVHLKRVFFQTRMPELDALLLENKMHRELKTYVDRRIQFAGMRSKKRWSGDTECYRWRAKGEIIARIEVELKRIETGYKDYWAEFEQYERPDFSVHRVGRPKGQFNPAKPVINLDTGERFSSVTAAAQSSGTSQGNISSVLAGKRSKAGGCRWAWERS